VRWRTFHASAGQSRAPPLGLTDFWKKRRRSSAASLRWDITTSRVIDNHNRHYQITKIAWFPKSPRENFCFFISRQRRAWVWLLLQVWQPLWPAFAVMHEAREF
jgi:hypothetical protein